MNSVTVPLPPSVNRAFRNVAKRGRVKTQVYNDWLTEAGWEVRRAYPTKVKGPCRVSFVFGKPDKRKRDLDNLLKASIDLLVRHQLIEDDSLIQELNAEWDVSGEVKGAVLSWEAA